MLRVGIHGIRCGGSDGNPKYASKETLSAPSLRKLYSAGPPFYRLLDARCLYCSPHMNSKNGCRDSDIHLAKRCRGRTEPLESPEHIVVVATVSLLQLRRALIAG